MFPPRIERGINQAARFVLEKRHGDIAVETHGFEEIQNTPAPHAIILFGPHDKAYDSTLLMRAFGEITPDRSMYILGRAESRGRLPNPLIVPVWAPVPGENFREKMRRNQEIYSSLTTNMIGVSKSVVCIAPNVPKGEDIIPRSFRVGSLMGMVECFARSDISVMGYDGAAQLAEFPLYMQTDREDEAHLYMGGDIYPQIADLYDPDTGLSRKSGPMKMVVSDAFASLWQNLQE